MKRFYFAFLCLLGIIMPRAAQAAINVSDYLTTAQVNAGGDKQVVLYLPYSDGTNRYWNATGNGIEMQQQTLQASCLFVIESVDGGVVLRNVKTNLYFSAANPASVSDGNPVASTSDKTNAVVFTAVAAASHVDNVVEPDASLPEAEKYGMRLTVAGTNPSLNLLQNGQKYGSGTGCWSILYMRLAEEVEDVEGDGPLPSPGFTYYIKCLIDPSNDGNYSHLLFRNESGTSLTVVNGNDKSDANKWLCESTESDGTTYYQFKNVATNNYLKHKGVQNSSYNFKLADCSSTYNGYVSIYSSADDRYFLVKKDGTFDQADRLYNPSNEDYSSYYLFENINKSVDRALTIEQQPSYVGATVQGNGTDVLDGVINYESGKSNAVTLSIKEGSYDADIYTFLGFFDAEGHELGKTYTVAAGQEDDLTIKARFSFNIFSANYGEKWVRMYNGNNNAHYAVLTSDQQTPKTATLDYAQAGQLWCLVGDENGFKAYNLLTGEGAVMTAQDNTPAESETITMQAENGSSTQTWKLVETSIGASIAPSDNLTVGWNPYGGVGNALKFYANASDKGSQWYFRLGTDQQKTLKITFADLDITFAGQDKADVLNYRLGALTLTCGDDGQSGTTSYRLSDFDEASTITSHLYLGNGTIAYNTAESTSYDGYICMINDARLTNEPVALTGNDEIVFTVDEDYCGQYLFYNGDNPTGVPFRIPAIGTMSDGTLLAITDMRTCGADIGNGRVDLWCKTSSDNGKTWSNYQVIAQGNGVTASNATAENPLWKCGFGDAALCVDGNDILLMCVGGRVVYGYGSTTEHNAMVRITGKYDPSTKTIAWNEPEDQTDLFVSILPTSAHTMFIGSGRLNQSLRIKAEGAQHNRIYAPLLCKSNGNIVVYSDDFGASWSVLGSTDNEGRANASVCSGGNEPKTVELPNGDVLLSSRKYNGRFFNVFTYDEGSTTSGSWSTSVASNSVDGGLSWGGNSCNGDIMLTRVTVAEDDVRYYLLQSCPTGNARSDVKVYRRQIDPSKAYTPTEISQNWEEAVVVSTKASAYSALTELNDGSFGVFYEEVPGGYSMVYKAYSGYQMLGVNGMPTAINNAEAAANAAAAAVAYDLSGRQVAAPSAGLYIVGGNKVLVK